MSDKHPPLSEVAAAMRAAYNEHAFPSTSLLPWDKSTEEVQEAWLVCARAAFKAIFGAEYSH